MLKVAEILIPSHDDDRGTLTVVEGGQDIPFDIKRVFALTNCRGVRGGHLNPGAYVLIMLAGAVDVEVEDARLHQLWTGRLTIGPYGLYTPANSMVHLSCWAENSVLLVLSDWHYMEARP